MTFAAELETRISSAAVHQEAKLGWRLLMSPAETLDGASVAFVGLNPGGGVKPTDHAEFAMPQGQSAYRDEGWSGPPGGHPLQRQVLALFDVLRIPPEKVLAGNLAPFRAPNWSSLAHQRDALVFGSQIWDQILAQAKPALVVTMGGLVEKALLPKARHKVPLGWGRVCGRWATREGVRWVALPHLSRFRVITRDQSQDALATLFGPHWHARS